MTRRAIARCRVVAAGMLAIALGVSATGAESAWDIAALMQLLKSHPAGRALFHETKHVSILDRPLETSGELLFTPPDRLERRVTSPGSERMLADRDKLTIERGGRTQVLPLAEYPEVAMLIESIRGTLAGDRAALERAYGLRLEGDARAWRLVLTPREPALARLVTSVEIDGSEARVQRVEIEQADGDSSLMQIAPVNP